MEGDKPAEQEPCPAAVQVARTYCKAKFGREPQLEDRLSHTLRNYPGWRPGPLTCPTLWARVREIRREARREGVLLRDLEFSPHLFRRTFATLYYRQTRDLKATQLATRHRSVDVLMRHYVDSAEGTSERVEKMLA